jgi:hypothetical protein
MQDVVKIGEPHLSADGKQVRFTATCTDSATFDCTFPLAEIETVVESLLNLITSARVNQSRESAGKPAPTDPWMKPPVALLAQAFWTSRNTSTGALILRIEPLTGPIVDVVFQPFHFDSLRAMLLDETPLGPAPGSH